MADDGFSYKWRPEGLAALDRELSVFSQKFKGEILDKAVYDAANIVVKDAKNRVVTRTGLLGQSIVRKKYRRGGRKAGFVGTSIMVRKKAYYAWWVEFGHRLVFRSRKKNSSPVEKQFIPARPFLRPALEENKEKIVAELIVSTRKKISEYKAKGIS